MRFLDVGRRTRAGLAAVSLIAGVAGLAGATPALAATTYAGAALPATTADAAPPHIMTIMMENTDYSQFAGSPAMPYLNEIAHQYADFTDAWGWTYPSLPNYLELLSGSDDGTGTTATTSGNDCDITQAGCNNFTNPTLVDQLEKAGISWNAYYQGDPAGCYQGDGSGNYPYWHNAFRYFADFAQQCSHISDYSDLLSNLNSANAADFQWLVPDLVGSGGDNGTMSSGDSWLAGELPKIMDTSWYREGGQIVILYDTGYEEVGGIGQSTGKAGGGQIPMVVVSAHTKRMGRSRRRSTPPGCSARSSRRMACPTWATPRTPATGRLARHSSRAARAATGQAVRARSRSAMPSPSATARRTSWPRCPARSRSTGVAPQVGGASAPGHRGRPEQARARASSHCPASATQVVSGASDLESVSCSAAGSATRSAWRRRTTDEAVLVSITADRVASVTTCQLSSASTASTAPARAPATRSATTTQTTRTR